MLPLRNIGAKGEGQIRQIRRDIAILELGWNRPFRE